MPKPAATDIPPQSTCGSYGPKQPWWTKPVHARDRLNAAVSNAELKKVLMVTVRLSPT
jgi:hypothetical protein